jgi:hypothetical protein
MIDRRKTSREFMVSGWDPHILSLLSGAKNIQSPSDLTPTSRKLGPMRWRAVLLSRFRSKKPV